MSYLRFATKIRPQVTVDDDCPPRPTGTLWDTSFESDDFDVAQVTPNLSAGSYGTDWVNASAGSKFYARASDQAHTGSWSIKVTFTSTADNNSDLLAVMDESLMCPEPEFPDLFTTKVAGGDIVNASIWARTTSSVADDNSGPTLVLVTYDIDGNFKSLDSDNISGSGTWQELSVSQTAAEVGYVRALISHSAIVADSYPFSTWLDDFFLEVV